MNKQNLKIAIVAILLSWATNPMLMLIHTGIRFISEIKLDAPLSAYFIYGYFPLIVAGIYIGFSKTTSRIQIGILVSILYLLKRTLFSADSKKHIAFLNNLKNKLEYKKTRPERPGCF